MALAQTMERQTKYCTAIENTLREYRHASNIQLLDALRIKFPELSATTVHRATSRLSSRNKIGVAPRDRDGSLQYDTNVIPHDHFLCASCGMLRDIDIKDSILPLLHDAISGCSISGRLTISGICRNCKRENTEE